MIIEMVLNAGYYKFSRSYIKKGKSQSNAQKKVTKVN